MATETSRLASWACTLKFEKSKPNLSPSTSEPVACAVAPAAVTDAPRSARASVVPATLPPAVEAPSLPLRNFGRPAYTSSLSVSGMFALKVTSKRGTVPKSRTWPLKSNFAPSTSASLRPFTFSRLPWMARSASIPLNVSPRNCSFATFAFSPSTGNVLSGGAGAAGAVSTGAVAVVTAGGSTEESGAASFGCGR